MANNFKITTANGWISKNGHDSNDGLNPDRPKRSFANITGVTIIAVGAGYYTLGGNMGNAGSLTFIADGYVVLDAQGFSLNPFATYNKFEIRNASLGVSGTQNGSFINCKFVNCSGGSSNGRSRTFIRCLFINCTNIMNGATTRTILNNCIVSNSSIIVNSNDANARGTVNNSIIDSSSILVLDSTITSADFNYNDCQGIIQISGVQYELKQQKNGSAITSPNPSYADLSTLWSNTYTTQKNFNQDPKHNDVAAGDYSLQADSPCIFADSAGTGNIGGGEFAFVGSSFNNSDNGVNGTIVAASANIDTSIINAYKTVVGTTEGYIDYVFYQGGLTMGKINPKTSFQFDTDYAGGTTQNSNVVDSQPLTADYAKITTTNANTGSTSTIQVPSSAAINIGNYVRVLGQDRLVTNKSTAGSNDTLTLDAALRAAVASGTEVTYGTAAQLAALLPNRITVLMRTRSIAAAPSYPFVDSEWDNEVSASYGVAGQFLQQEIFKQPGIIISGSNVYGTGDSAAPTGISPQTLSPMWVHVRVYLRNNYSSKGL